MDDTLRADTSIPTCHLTIVSHHFFRNFPVLHIVIFTDQRAISDDNTVLLVLDLKSQVDGQILRPGIFDGLS